MDNFLDIGGMSVYKAAMDKKHTKKPEVNFNEFWPSLVKLSHQHGLRKVEWMNRSGVPYQRYSEFSKGTRDVSAQFFIKLLGGLNLTLDKVEATLGKRLSEKQKAALRYQVKVDANRDWLELLLDDPEACRLCKRLVLAKKTP